MACVRRCVIAPPKTGMLPLPRKCDAQQVAGNGNSSGRGWRATIATVFSAYCLGIRRLPSIVMQGIGPWRGAERPARVSGEEIRLTLRTGLLGSYVVFPAAGGPPRQCYDQGDVKHASVGLR